MGIAFQNLKSKNKLRDLLYLDKTFHKLKEDGFFNEMFNIFLMKTKLEDGTIKKRIVESPRDNIKRIHKRVLKLLEKVETPDYLYSVKGKSYVDNHESHMFPYVAKIDISKFFPNCLGDRVYKYFFNDLQMSSDTAFWLTEMLVINYERENVKKEIGEYINAISKKQYFPISSRHLPTGSPVSPLLSFLSYQALFDQIHRYCLNKGVNFTLYVDDVTLSSKNKISKKTIYDIYKMFYKFGLPINKNKTTIYKPSHDKLITGVIVNKYNMVRIPNRLHRKYKKLLVEYNKTKDSRVYNRLSGVKNAMHQINLRKKSE